MIGLGDLNSFHLDILKEIGNIGAGHAATSLSKLIKKKVDMCVPSVKLATFNEVTQYIGDAGEVVVAVCLDVEGDTTFSMFYIFSIEQANYFIQTLLNEPNFSLLVDGLTEVSTSVIGEIGNILTGSYLTALYDFTKLELQASVPMVVVDMFGAIISYGLVDISNGSDYTLLIDTELLQDDQGVKTPLNGHLLIIPHQNTIHIILQALGVI